MKSLETENDRLKAENAKLLAAVNAWKAKYEDLKQRALKAYYSQKEEIERLREIINEKDDKQG